MTRIPDPPEPHVAASPRPGSEATEPDIEAGTLPGRMLHVSRLATIGEMAAGVAHELNQPLTAIANYAQACDRLLGKSNADLAELRTAVREIASQAVRAGEIIRRLRSLARNQPVERGHADINSVINEILDLMQTDARMHRARLLLELAEELPYVSIDRVQIQHVVLNLVHNGLESPSGDGSAVREVKICTGRSNTGDVEIAVSDNGPGISPEALHRMFDPFFSTKQSGTGLGLPISNTIVRAHGGTLGYRTNQPRGACFYFHLPPDAAE